MEPNYFAVISSGSRGDGTGDEKGTKEPDAVEEQRLEEGLTKGSVGQEDHDVGEPTRKVDHAAGTIPEQEEKVTEKEGEGEDKVQVRPMSNKQTGNENELERNNAMNPQEKSENTTEVGVSTTVKSQSSIKLPRESHEEES